MALPCSFPRGSDMTLQTPPRPTAIRRVLRLVTVLCVLLLAACSARVATPPPLPPSARPPAPAVPSAVQVRCDPCRPVAGEAVLLVADAADPDGMSFEYIWIMPDGSSRPGGSRIHWTGTSEGPAVIRVRVTDRHGGEVSGDVALQVVSRATAASDTGVASGSRATSEQCAMSCAHPVT
jgi:hypothetical protein